MSRREKARRGSALCEIGAISATESEEMWHAAPGGAGGRSGIIGGRVRAGGVVGVDVEESGGRERGAQDGSAVLGEVEHNNSLDHPLPITC